MYMRRRQLRHRILVDDEEPPAFTSSATGHTVQLWDNSQAAAANTAVWMPGLFEHVPASWLHLFIRSLPAGSKATLFACSKWLATRVLEASPHVTIRLSDDSWLTKGPQRTAQQKEVQRSIITQLFRVRKKFEVELGLSEGWVAFPAQLADRVTSLSLTGEEDVYGPGQPVSSCCQWAAMTALRAADLGHKGDFTGICEAVEAGHLQQLRKVRIWWPGYEQSDDAASDKEEPDEQAWVDRWHVVDVRDIDRLAQVVGPQLEELCTMSQTVLRRVQHMTVLQRLTVENMPGYCADITLTDKIMQQLCEHPTLRHVKLSYCLLESDNSCRSCKWESLELDHMHLHEMAKLPLASVQHILLHTVDRTTESELQPLEANLAQNLHKITYTPRCDHPCRRHKVKLYKTCAAVVSLVACMQGVEELALQEGWSASCSIDVVHQIWEILPMSVRSISFAGFHGMQWAEFWQGVPLHVVQVAIMSCQISAEELRTLVGTAPAHIQSMWLDPPRLLQAVQRGGILPKILHAVAPKNLKLYYAVHA